MPTGDPFGIAAGFEKELLGPKMRPSESFIVPEDIAAKFLDEIAGFPRAAKEMVAEIKVSAEKFHEMETTIRKLTEEIKAISGRTTGDMSDELKKYYKGIGIIDDLHPNAGLIEQLGFNPETQCLAAYGESGIMTRIVRLQDLAVANDLDLDPLDFVFSRFEVIPNGLSGLASEIAVPPGEEWNDAMDALSIGMPSGMSLSAAPWVTAALATGSFAPFSISPEAAAELSEWMKKTTEIPGTFRPGGSSWEPKTSLPPLSPGSMGKMDLTLLSTSSPLDTMSLGSSAVPPVGLDYGDSRVSSNESLWSKAMSLIPIRWPGSSRPSKPTKSTT
jgi:hypothetical protein